MTRSISARTATMLAALGLAAGVGSVAALAGAAGDDPASAAGAQTLVFTAKVAPGEAGGIDTGPKGISVGDTLVDVVSLRQAGKPAGRMHVVGTVLDTRYQGTQQALTIFVRGGTIEALGGGVNRAVPGAGASSTADVRAVVGGTGDYAGAAGELEIAGSRVTIRLR